MVDRNVLFDDIADTRGSAAFLYAPLGKSGEIVDISRANAEFFANLLQQLCP